MASPLSANPGCKKKSRTVEREEPEEQDAVVDPYALAPALQAFKTIQEHLVGNKPVEWFAGVIGGIPMGSMTLLAGEFDHRCTVAFAQILNLPPS